MAVFKIPKTQSKKMLKNQKEITDHSHNITSSVDICPFFITSGSVSLTERGEIAGNLNKDDFTTFQKVFVGGSLITATWVDSTKAQTVNIGDAEQKIHGQLVKTYEKGKVITANLSAESNTSVFESVVGSEDFIAQKTNRTFQVSILADQWDAMYENCLFVVPEFDINQWLYLQSFEYERDADPDAANATRQINLTFASLQDSISSTGNNVRQFVQRSAPGEGFAWPKIDKQTKLIGLDENYLKDTPITKIQFEFDAPMAISALQVFGRKVGDADTNNIVECPQHLLISRFNSPETNEITKIGNATPNFYVGKGQMSMEGWDEWYNNIKDAYDEFRSKNFEGFLRVNAAALKATNQTIDLLGYYEFQLWKDGWNTISGADGVEGPYDTQADYWTGSSLIIGAQTAMYDVMNHAQFIVGQFLKLPLSVKEHTVVAFSTIPLIGGISKFITAGIPFGWGDTQTIVPSTELPLFLPAELVDFTRADASNPDLIPADYFRGKDNSDTVGGLISTNTTFNVELTHLYDRGTSTPAQDTNELGQLDQDGNKIIWTGDCRALPSGYDSVNQGYIIDHIGISAIGKANVKITMYRGSSKVYEGVVQTKSKYTEEIREWKTDIKCSFWDNAELIFGEQIRYPEAITPPPAPEGEAGLPIIVEPTPSEKNTALLSIAGERYNDVVLNYQNENLKTLDMDKQIFTLDEIISAYSLIRIYYEIANEGTNYNSSIVVSPKIYEADVATLNQVVNVDVDSNSETNEVRRTIGSGDNTSATWGFDVVSETKATLNVIRKGEVIEARLITDYLHKGEFDTTTSVIEQGRNATPHENAREITIISRIELIP